MLDVGLGGAAAGGPAAASPQSSLSLTETPDASAAELPVDTETLARAFRELMDAFEEKAPAAEPLVSEAGETSPPLPMAQAITTAPQIYDLDAEIDTDNVPDIDTDIDPLFEGVTEVDGPDDEDESIELLTWLAATEPSAPLQTPARPPLDGKQPVARTPAGDQPKAAPELIAAEAITTTPVLDREPAPHRTPDLTPASNVPAQEIRRTPVRALRVREEPPIATAVAKAQPEPVPAATPAALVPAPLLPFAIAPLTRRTADARELPPIMRTPVVTAAKTVAVITPALLPAGPVRLPIGTVTQVPAPAVVPSPTAQQIVQSLRLAVSRHGGEARIKLDPVQFGDLSIAMRVDRGQVVARVQADSPAVREWLQTNQDTLRAGLAGQHLRLDRLEIITADEARESRPRDDERQSGREHQPQPRRQRKPSAGATFDIVA